MSIQESIQKLQERFDELMDFIEENELQEEFIEWVEKRKKKTGDSKLW